MGGSQSTWAASSLTYLLLESVKQSCRRQGLVNVPVGAQVGDMEVGSFVEKAVLLDSYSNVRVFSGDEVEADFIHISSTPLGAILRVGLGAPKVKTTSAQRYEGLYARDPDVEEVAGGRLMLVLLKAANRSTGRRRGKSFTVVVVPVVQFKAEPRRRPRAVSLVSRMAFSWARRRARKADAAWKLAAAICRA